MYQRNNICEPKNCKVIKAEGVAKQYHLFVKELKNIERRKCESIRRVALKNDVNRGGFVELQSPTSFTTRINIKYKIQGEPPNEKET